MKLRSFVLAAGITILAGGAAFAQAPQGPDALTLINRMAVDSSHLERLAHSLLDSIGPRLSGTPQLERGSDWLVKQYRSWGIEARNEPTGTWRGWRRGHSHIDLVSPRARSLEGTMLAYSPGTGSRDVTSSTIILPRFSDSAGFVRWLPQAKGKLVLVSAPMPTCRATQDYVQHATDASRRALARRLDSISREWGATDVRGTGYGLALGTGTLGLRLESAGASGIITSRPTDAWGTVRIFETYNTRAPAVSLSCEDYGLVYRLTESGATPRIRMNLDAELLGERPVFNTIAMIRGIEKPDEYVVLSSHFDTWDGASGATDNGTGTLLMMETMRILKSVYPNPRRTIISGHWTTEEQGTHGSRAFAEDHPEVLKGMQVLFNHDTGTGRITRISGAGLPDAAAHLTRWLSRLPEPLKGQVSYEGPGRPARRGSDDASFSCHGIPAFNLGSLSWSYGNYTWHTNRDTYDKLVFEDLKSNAALAATLAYLASEEESLVSREKVAGPDTTGREVDWPQCVPAGRKTEPRL